jgi:CBS domain-containing protein
MNRDFPVVTVTTTLDKIIEQNVLNQGQSTFFVVGVGLSEPKGMLTLADITRVPRQEWPYVTAARIMTPLDQLLKIEPDTDLLDAIQKMDQANVSQAPVVQGRHVEGLLTRHQVLEYLRCAPRRRSFVRRIEQRSPSVIQTNREYTRRSHLHNSLTGY